jgi:hypothetical protein
MAYGNAVISYQQSLLSGPSKGGSDNIPMTLTRRSRGIEIRYPGQPPVEVILTGWSVGNGSQLTLSPLASDPRINLATDSPHNSSADPLEESALFIAPFNWTKSLVWYNGYWLNKIIPERWNQGIITTTTGFFEFNSMTSLLEDHGFENVWQLMDEDTDVITLCDHLIPSGEYKTPGFIVFNTHSGDGGNLGTGTLVSTTNRRTNAYREGLVAALDTIKNSQYASMLTYLGGEEDNPKTIGVMAVHRQTKVRGSNSFYISLTPLFWDWLHTQGADFSRSLVYIAGCLTDQTPDLRNAIKARAYFAFSETTTPEMAGQTFQYFCKSLVKHTHTAEESYYNIQRISTTKQMIYPEDDLFNGVIMPNSEEQLYTTWKIFKGYAYDGAQVVSYNDAGWLAPDDLANAGNIWWVLYASRWSEAPADGAAAVLDCWNRCWKNDTTGGLGEVFCQNAAPGMVPEEDEVGYALYLLTGEAQPSYSGTSIPRWTFNDGGD